MRNTCPNRSSYATLPATRAPRDASATPDCSAADVPVTRSPIRGCSAMASSTSPHVSEAKAEVIAASSASAEAYGRPAATTDANARDPQQDSIAASASAAEAALKKARDTPRLFRQRVRPGHLGVVLATALEDPLPRGEVDERQPEPLSVPFGPLEVVKQRAGEVA